VVRRLEICAGADVPGASGGANNFIQDTSAAVVPTVSGSCRNGDVGHAATPDHECPVLAGEAPRAPVAGRVGYPDRNRAIAGDCNSGGGESATDPHPPAEADLKACQADVVGGRDLDPAGSANPDQRCPGRWRSGIARTGIGVFGVMWR
jgi:hypothetical protein